MRYILMIALSLTGACGGAVEPEAPCDAVRVCPDAARSYEDNDGTVHCVACQDDDGNLLAGVTYNPNELAADHQDCEFVISFYQSMKLYCPKNPPHIR